MQKENIIYADLKVKNILLNSEDINKFQFDISYCGISQNNYNKIHSKSTNKIENYLTLSPQILKGEEFTNKTDIWSLGIIIYYLLFKKYPYNGKTEFQIINQMKAGVNLNNIENNNLKDLIKRMLEINEDVRISWEDYFNHPFFKEKNENNEDNTFTFQDFNFLCNQHNQYYDSYCFNCKKNVCKLCLSEHQLHKIILFTNIGLNKSEIEKYEKLKNEINNNLMILNKYKDEIENLLCFIKNIKTNNSIYDNDSSSNFKNYYINYLVFINKKIKILNLDIHILDIYNYCFYDINKDNINDTIQLLNCYEDIIEEYSFYEDKGEKNKNEIQNNIELYLNYQKLDSNFKNKFSIKGNNCILLLLKNPLSNTNYLFSNCSSLTKLNLCNFDTQNVTDMRGMFSNCCSLKTLNISGFITKNVINMSYMFFKCFSLRNLDLSNFNTEKVTDLSSMFFFCTSLISLNISNFNTKNVVNMNKMFSNCSSLISLDLSNFNTNIVENMNEMFYQCISLESLNLSNFNLNKMLYLSSLTLSDSTFDFSHDNNNFDNIFSDDDENDIRNNLFYGLNKNCKVVTNDEQILKILKKTNSN